MILGLRGVSIIDTKLNTKDVGSIDIGFRGSMDFGFVDTASKETVYQILGVSEDAQNQCMVTSFSFDKEEFGACNLGLTALVKREKEIVSRLPLLVYMVVKDNNGEVVHEYRPESVTLLKDTKGTDIIVPDGEAVAYTQGPKVIHNTFKDSEGRDYGEIGVFEGTQVIPPELMIPDQLELEKWVPELEAKASKDTDYLAQYKTKTYTVKYLPGEGGQFEVQSYEVLPGGELPKFDGEVTPKEGYVFRTWDKELPAIVNSDLTLTALWDKEMVTLTFVKGDHGEISVETMEVEYGSNAPSYSGEITPAEGYEFTGWSPALEGTITEEATYTAQYQKKQFTITLKPGENGNFTDQIISCEYGDDVVEKVATFTPTPKDGYVFKEWSPQPTGTVTGNLEFTAVFEVVQFTITLKPGDHGAFEETQVTANSGADVQEVLSSFTPIPAEGYEFVAWTPAPSSTVTQNMEFTATWQTKKIDVALVFGEGSDWEDKVVQVDFGTDAVTFMSTQEPLVKEEYLFKAWNPVPVGQITEDCTYIAVYARRYQVTLNPGEHGTGEPKVFRLEEGTDLAVELAKPEHIPTGDGATFSGWEPEPTGNISSDVVFTAKWTTEQVE